MDRSHAFGPGTQLAVVVLDPGPPGGVGVLHRQPDVGRFFDDVARQQLDQQLALALVLFQIGVGHALVEIWV